jgi:uncharacterized cysteine cluster protein YcgN (CxxCxxCC family)
MECDGCTLCCYALDIPQYKSPSGEYCKHCDKNIGCTIHNERKDVCRDFGCLYWHEKNLPEYLNPKVCGFMIEIPKDCKVWIGYIDPEHPERWKNKQTKILFKKINDLGHPVVISDKNKDVKFFLPKGSMWTEEMAMREIAKFGENNI